MKRNGKLSKLLTLVLAFYSFSAFGQSGSRCVADLGRVDQSVCLSAGTKDLSYKWRANDEVFDLSAKACFTNDKGLGARRDMVFALDRSERIRKADTLARKLGADQVSILKAMIETLRAEAKADPAKAPKIGMMTFASDPACSEWSGAPIALNRNFPCLFVRAATLADDIHYDRLLKFLTEIDGKYAPRGDIASDFTIVAGQVGANVFGLASTQKSGLVLMTDARSYRGPAGELFPHLRILNYTTAQNEALNAFAAPAMKTYQLLVAMTPQKTPIYDNDDIYEYDNMCGANPPSDCSAPTVIDEPATWPINKIDIKAYISSLAAAIGTPAADAYFEMKDKPSFEAGLEKLRITDNGSIAITEAAYRVNGGELKPVQIDGARLLVPTLPVGQDLKVDLVVKVMTSDVTIPVTMSTEKIASEGVEFQDKEMFCAPGIAPATESPKLNLSDLQGGSGSCGSVPGEGGGGAKPAALFLLLALPLLAVAVRARRSAVLVAAVAVTATTARAEGLNALNYRPVVDGVATTEKASVPEPGQFNAGFYMDYANDAIEISGSKGKRFGSVMDDLVTAHAAANVGIFRRTALGAHVPFVYKTDLDRRAGGDTIDGQKMGRPSDAAVTLKVNIASQRALSLGVMPMVTIPAGKPEELTGDGDPSFGALLLASGSEGPLSWAGNLGYMHRQKALLLQDDRARTVTMRGQFQIMGGLDYKIVPMLALGGGVQFKPAYGERIDFTRANPAEWTMVAKLRPTGGALETQAGFGTGLGKGVGSPDYRVYAGVSYVPSAAPARRVAAGNKQ